MFFRLDSFQTKPIIFGLCFVVLQGTIGTGVYGQGFNWKFGDFVIAGLLLFGTGLGFEFVFRKVKSVKYRILICCAIFFALVVVWAELAVGIFGTPFAGS